MAMQVALKEDLRSQLRTLQQLRLLLDLFGVDWSNLWLQQQDGSVVRAEHAVDLGLGRARGHAHLLPISCPSPAHLLPISCPPSCPSPAHLRVKCTSIRMPTPHGVYGPAHMNMPMYMHMYMPIIPSSCPHGVYGPANMYR